MEISHPIFPPKKAMELWEDTGKMVKYLDVVSNWLGSMGYN